ncbi:MAG: acyl-CoA synthetase FdrA [Deltaproteobacteria bacterium]|nr:acyl-CoA synthetase FdrA [Deltaproteobacteria bacterium]MBW2049231.1 acyl-CoA synthetase FdrA [Deltaproteobacteria bacterium]MBW2112135.1 acyl-CoA synthetase FdrA [Deltaproteobacteria bacterium]MBW2354073.1 acyl-CoA synthetase FdrA [Deltaproteobacteria bacterium]
MKKLIIRRESYYDSVFLMLASRAAKQISGVIEAAAVMGTETNVDLLQDIGFDETEFEDVRPNDLMVAVEAESEEAITEALEAVNEFLNKKTDFKGEEAYRPVSLSNAIRFAPQSNLVLISVPGAYAAREARMALNNDLHVMLFSDNVPIEDEIELKKTALDRGLLMMGPDCGTAIINGKPLCFANRVRQGDIGLVAASGSGLQEVTSCIHRMGAGISQAIGTGGRDLKDPRVGGLMMKMGIQALSHDRPTRVIVVISKPPAQALVEDAISWLKKTGKPCVICFLGQRKRPPEEDLWFAESLEETARLAVRLSRGEGFSHDAFAVSPGEIEEIAAGEIKRMDRSQRYLRGLYAGGTLADEAIFGLESEGIEIYSNVQSNQDFLLQDPRVSRKHTIIDLGDDTFTLGRPHPMIDPSIREERLRAEVADPEVAVVLMDFVLGDGAHENPAGEIVDCLVKARQFQEKTGRHISIVASITGTDEDFQDMDEQKKILESQDCIVMPSNYQAGLVAAAIIRRIC